MWKQLAYKTGIWLTAEIWLNLMGLDNYADYSEFIFAQDLYYLNIKNSITVKINEYLPQFCPKIDDFCPISAVVTVTKSKPIHETTDLAATEILKNKCKQLKQPCLKIICLKPDIFTMYID
jgi:hypothetical protein